MQEAGAGLRRERPEAGAALGATGGRRDDVNVAEAPELRGGADGGEAGRDPGGDRGGAGQEAGGQGLRQGVRGAGAVPGAAQGRGAVPGVAEGDVRRQRAAGAGLRRVPAGVVQRLPLSPQTQNNPWTPISTPNTPPRAPQPPCTTTS